MLPADTPSPRQGPAQRRRTKAEPPAGILSPRQVSAGRSSSTVLPADTSSPRQGPAQRRRTKAELQASIHSPPGHCRDGRSGSAAPQVGPSIAH